MPPGDPHVQTQTTGALTLRVTYTELGGHRPETGNGKLRITEFAATGVGWFTIELHDQTTGALLWATDVDVCTTEGTWDTFSFGVRETLVRDMPPGLGITTRSGDPDNPHRTRVPGTTRDLLDRSPV